MKFHVVILLVLSIYAILTLAKPSRPFILKLFRHDAEKDQKLYITKENDATISHLSPNREPPVFLAKSSIGEPPVPQLLHVDTGSSFTWVKCVACNTCQTQLSGYNPTASSTYSNVSCGDFSYKLSPALSPVKRTGECHYRQMYFDGSESRGTLAKETILFDTEDDGIKSVSHVEFGCAHDIIDGFSVGTGLLGLAYGKFSILKQFSNKEMLLNVCNGPSQMLEWVEDVFQPCAPNWDRNLCFKTQLCLWDITQRSKRYYTILERDD